jgi:hypothetical protein
MSNVSAKEVEDFSNHCVYIHSLYTFALRIFKNGRPDERAAMEEGAASRFDRMPSKPIAQACRKTSLPAASVCSQSAMPGVTRQPCQAILALTEGQRAEVLPVQLQQIEGLQDSLAHPAAAVERIEHRDTIHTADDGLAIKGE